MRSRNLWASGEEVAALIKSSGLSLMELCRFFDVSRGTTNNWQAERNPCPRPVLHLLQFMATNPEIAAYARSIDQAPGALKEQPGADRQPGLFDPPGDPGEQVGPCA